jgi:hypothetical protein
MKRYDYVRDIHSTAMDLADYLKWAKTALPHTDALEGMRKRGIEAAYRLERQAADTQAARRKSGGAKADGTNQWTAVLYRSAAWLAHNAGLYAQAIETAEIGLSYASKEWIKTELNEVLNAAREAA